MSNRVSFNKIKRKAKNNGFIFKEVGSNFYQFYENYIANEERLTIKRAVSRLKIPYLIIHGDADTSVLIEEAHTLHNWNTNSCLETIKGANHVFGAQHPWEKEDSKTIQDYLDN